MTNAIGPRDMTRIAKALESIFRELRRMQEPDCRTHGKWIFNTDESNGKSWNICSVCGESIFHAMNFCPNCGADMRGDTNDQV